jgi:acyl carrier protein phosphodiesterase
LNYLAHLALSGNNPETRFGNFIADHVKGSSMSAYSIPVQKGITLHRAIDVFTDSHTVTASGKARLRPYVRKYAPVALDIIYDHFLALNWNHYFAISLHDFLLIAYNELDQRIDVMPERMKNMYTYMKKDNWLSGYAEMEGLLKALTGLSRRTKFESNLQMAIVPLKSNYNDFEKEFHQFFPALQRHVLTIL